MRAHKKITKTGEKQAFCFVLFFLFLSEINLKIERA